MSKRFNGLVRLFAYTIMITGLAITSLHISEVDVWQQRGKVKSERAKI